MRITRMNPFNLKKYTLEIPVTQQQLDNWKNGMLIQNAMPNLNPEQREFIKTGILGDDWDDMFDPDPE
jgi:hypothetical protein